MLVFPEAQPQVIYGAPLSLGLYAAYDMAVRDTEKLYDSAQHAHNGTFINGPQWVDSDIGPAIEFDSASSQYILTNVNKSIGGFEKTGHHLTVSIWAKIPAGGYMTINDNGPINGRWFLSFNDTVVVAGAQNGQDGYMQYSATITDTWVHLAAVFNAYGATDADKVKIFVNGVQVAASAIGTLSGTFSSQTGQIYIGGYPFYSAYGEGFVKGVRIWNRDLSKAEIYLNYRYPELAYTDDTLLVPMGGLLKQPSMDGLSSRYFNSVMAGGF